MAKDKPVGEPWLQALGVGVVIEVDLEDEERLPSGLIKPSITKRNQFIQKGTVVAVGEGRLAIDSTLPGGFGHAPLRVKVGDRVLFPRMGTSEVEHDGKKYVVIPEPNLLGILKKE